MAGVSISLAQSDKEFASIVLSEAITRAREVSSLSSERETVWLEVIKAVRILDPGNLPAVVSESGILTSKEKRNHQIYNQIFDECIAGGRITFAMKNFSISTPHDFLSAFEKHSEVFDRDVDRADGGVKLSSRIFLEVIRIIGWDYPTWASHLERFNASFAD